MTGKRLATGGRIDRNRPLRFTFDGRGYTGFAGDTLASALLANGVRTVARSFKYHRPRGVVTAGVEEPAALVELLGPDASGNRQATTVPLTEGLAARSVNCWPSPRFDLGAVVQLAARAIPAGFYYKTFKWPGWALYAPAIRRAAGLASAPDHPPQGVYETRHAHCDLLVAGAGPAGLMAALVAARAGLRVVLADEGVEAGGALLSRDLLIDGAPARDWVAAVVAELAAAPLVTHLQQASVWGYREHNYLMVTETAPDRPGLTARGWRVRAGHVITATGALERGIAFAENDRPGVMLAGSVQTYLHRNAVAPWRRAVVFTNNNSAYAAAADLAAAGIVVAAIIDSRDQVPEDARARVAGLPLRAGHVVTRVLGRAGLRGVCVASPDGAEARIDCDLLAVSGGWNPSVHLWSQARGTLRYDADLAAFLPDRAVENVTAAGAAAGALGLPDALASGAEAGARVAGLPAPAVPQASDLPYAITPLWQVAHPRGKAFVDLQNDVTVADVELALREGYADVELVKRYTTAGMGLDQGKTGNVTVIGTLAQAQGRAPGEVGTTTFRAPWTPVAFGAIAGQRDGPLALPWRETPVTRWNIDRGAMMYEAGARWRRPGYFPATPDEPMAEAIARECRAVRFGVGVYDGSPLAKFEIKGPDAAAFLDHLYTNRMSSLKPRRGRYGLMLTDDGLILDDGVCFRLDAARWLVSGSTGHAEALHRHLEYQRQTSRPGWRVFITPVTEQWANATICGPQARAVMQALGCDFDLSAQAFPFMQLREGHVAGLPARVLRVSFTGELSYEVNVAPRHLPALWQQVMGAGAPHGILPVGSEANHVLRVEKGFLSLAHEVDGTADPHDLGLGWVMAQAKPDHLGQRAVAIRRAGGGVRRELVGVIPEGDTPLPEGAPLTPGGQRVASEGFITACVRSVVQDRWLGLALLDNGHARHGETAHVRLQGGQVIPVRVAAPIHYDPEGERLRS